MLRRMTDEALQAELDRRKAEREEVAMPQPVANPDWSMVRQMAVSHVERALLGKERNKNFDHFISAEAITTVYGADIWDTLHALRT